MTKEVLLKQAQDKLRHYQLDPNLASLLFAYLFKPTKTDLTKKELKLYNQKLTALLTGKPLQYVMGSVNFYGYEFMVTPSVLIPRFETEELVYHTINYIKKHFKESGTIIDVGTGSGVIAITLKKELPKAKVYATDISKKALQVSKTNAKKLNATVSFLEKDMLTNISDLTFDIIISNPPYLTKKQAIDKLVLTNEPHLALFGGSDGLKYYRQILKQAPSLVKPKFLLALEISEEVKDGVLKLVNKYFKDATYELKKDMSQRTRMLFIYNFD